MAANKRGGGARSGSTIKKLGARQLKVRVKTAAGREVSSTRWLERQLNDPYVAAAREAGYRSRAAFKLIELNERFDFLTPGATVLDLGAAPGGWSQAAAQQINRGKNKGIVLAVDLLPIEPIPDVHMLVLDFLAEDAEEQLMKALREAGAESGQVDVVLSDMAAPSTGHRQTDHLRVMGLCEAAFDFACQVLRPGGTFCAKVLRGGSEADLLKMMKQSFKSVRHVKPAASRADSRELYVLAQEFRGRKGPGDEASGETRP